MKCDHKDQLQTLQELKKMRPKVSIQSKKTKNVLRIRNT